MTASSVKEARVRIAPSPTGFLHLGTARTALFNWLFARNQGGKFILRIEDTDKERSKPEYEKDIIDGLKWLGLDWDEGPDIGGKFGPYRQSERGEIYEAYLRKLFDSNRAYFCFCSKEELDEAKKAMLAAGLAPKYSGKCRAIDPAQAAERVKNGEAAVIRFKVPPGHVEFNDLVRGKISVDAEAIGDLVVAKDFLTPLFLLAGAIDDHEMKITHVIRGEDHISNTPKQILIQQALGFDEIKYAHLPLILSRDRSKLSKRYADTALLDYAKEGYLPEAVINFMALLGWHPAAEKSAAPDKPAEEKEIMSTEEIISKFDLKRVQKSGAIFDLNKLDWLNSQYLKQLPDEMLAEKLKEFIPEAWQKNKELLIKTAGAEKARIKKLSDFKNLADFFFELPSYEKNLLIWQNAPKETILKNLKMLSGELDKISEAKYQAKELEKVLMPLTDIAGKGELLWPLRAALSGKTASPGPFEILEILGKNESLERVNIAIGKLT